MFRDKEYIDIRNIIARKSANLTGGRGFLFNCETEEQQNFIESWIEKNAVFQKFWQFCYDNSLRGRSHLYLVPTNNGKDLTIRHMKENLSCRVAMVDEIEQLAIIYTMPYQNDKGQLQKITIMQGKIIVESYNTGDSKIMINDINENVMSNLRPDNVNVYDSGINIIPIIETTNLPYQNQNGNSTLNMFPDTIAVENLIKDLQDNIQKKRLERTLNRTTGIGRIDNQSMMQLGSDLQKIMKNEAWINASSNDYSKTGNSLGVEIVQGDPKFDQYVLDQNNTMKLIFEGSGYDYDSESDMVYQNKTQSLMGSKRDIETTLIKRAYYQQKLYRLFDYIFIHYGFWNGEGVRPYSFEFIDSTFVDQIKQEELITSRLESRTISRSKAIQMLDKVSEKKARLTLEEIKKEEEEFGFDLEENENDNDKLEDDLSEDEVL